MEDRFTYQSIDKKRGLEGIKTNEVSVVFKGIAVHDCWASYWNLENIKEHAVSCVHLLRELNGVIENEKVQSWASRFKQLLITILLGFILEFRKYKRACCMLCTFIKRA